MEKQEEQMSFGDQTVQIGTIGPCDTNRPDEHDRAKLLKHPANDSAWMREGHVLFRLYESLDH